MLLLNNSYQNQLNFQKDTESKYTFMHSDDNFKNNKSEVPNLNTSENKNNIKQNGEVENQLSNKLEQTQERKYFENRRNNKRNINNEFVRPAGLSSERCTRDFMSAKNRKYHWNYNKMNNDYFSQVYKDQSSEGGLDTPKILNNKENEFETNNNSAANYIFKSNRMLRNENRLRNTRHSDIFGTNNEMNLKENLKRNLLNQSKSYSDYTSDHSLDTDLKFSNNSTDNVSTYSLNSKDNDFRNGFNLRDNDSVYSNHSMHDNSEGYMDKRPIIKKEELLNKFQKKDIINYEDSNRDRNDKESNRSRRDGRDKDSEDLDFDKRSKEYSIDHSYNEEVRRMNEDKELKEIKHENEDKKLFGVVCLNLSGLKSETCEKDLETLCRCCKLQILSINLDRNIITHTCTGTAKLKLKDPNQNNLTNLQDLLKLQGYKCKL